jgi:organic hydroperoxide reductase OsmC/OhrA
MTPTDQRANAGIRRSLVRLETAIARRPGFGHVTQSSTTRCGAGLACETREGDHLVRADLPHGLGGHDSAPSPGALMRAALGSCLAMGYRLRAARHDVPLDAIVVAVETDSVLAGMLDPTGVAPPGFTGVRVDVRLASPAPTRDLRSLIDEADLLSPMLDVVNRPNPVERSVHLARGGR